MIGPRELLPSYLQPKRHLTGRLADLLEPCSGVSASEPGFG